MRLSTLELLLGAGVVQGRHRRSPIYISAFRKTLTAEEIVSAGGARDAEGGRQTRSARKNGKRKLAGELDPDVRARSGPLLQLPPDQGQARRAEASAQDRGPMPWLRSKWNAAVRKGDETPKQMSRDYRDTG